MEKYSTKKLLNLFFIIAPMMVIYLLVFSIVQRDLNLLHSVIFSYLCTLLLFLLKMWIVNLVNLIMMKLLNRDVKFFSFYPFTFDGDVEFKPVKLLYHQELYLSQIPYNLKISDEEMISDLHTQFKTNVFLWGLAELIAIMLMSIFLRVIFGINVFLGFGLFFISSMFQLLKFSDLHFGYIYCLNSSDMAELLFSRVPPKFVSFKQYNCLISKFDTTKHRQKLRYAIILNYLYKCIYEEKSPINVEQIKDYLELSETSSVEQINCVKVLGIVGLIANNNEYLDISIKEIQKVVKYLQSINFNSMMDSSITRLIQFENFMKHPDFGSIRKGHVILGLYNIFKYSSEVEKRIIKGMSKNEL